MDNFNRKERLGMIFDKLKDMGKVHSQVDLAKAVGASEATISKALKGDEKALTDNLFKRINAAFGNIFNLEWMLRGCPPDPTDQYLDEVVNPPSPKNGLTTDSQRTHNGTTTDMLAVKNERIKLLEDRVSFQCEQLSAKDDIIAELRRQLQELKATKSN